MVTKWSPNRFELCKKRSKERREAKEKKILLQEKKTKAQQGNVKTTKTVVKGDGGARNNDKDG